MASTKYPQNFLDLSTQSSKKLALVVKIEGVSQYFSLVDLYTKIRYGDPGITYGEAGLVYGGLRLRSDVYSYLTLQGSLQIAQRLEPEQGRASVSTFTLIMLDKAGYFTNLLSPGQVINDILGDKEIKIYLGYQNSSFPEDFFVIYRGSVSTVSVKGAEVTLNLSDPTQKKRQPVFTPGVTKLSAGIDAVQTSIPVVSTGTFDKPITGPDSTVDPQALFFIQIDNEWMKVVSQTSTTFTVVRNAAPVGETAPGAAVHASGADVKGMCQLGVNTTSPIGINPITAALKIMLSGWNGPWTTGVSGYALGRTDDVTVPQTNVIRLQSTDDAVEDYGLTVGDWVTVSGSGAGNNGTYQITDMGADVTGRANRILFINTNLTPELGGTLAFRSQFDTLPVSMGLKMKPTEIDVAGHVSTRNQFFLTSDNNMEFCLTQEATGKDFIESELFYPLGIYSLTRYGRVSLGYTRPPITNQGLVVLDKDNIIKPEEITISRSLVNRRFYNEVDYRYDKSESNSNFASVSYWGDAESTNRFRQVSLLPIDSAGMRSECGSATAIARRAGAFLTRFKDVALELSLRVNWEAGSQIEVGDVVAVSDDGTLQIPNFATGSRGLNTQLFEVVDRKLSINDGTAQLLLLSGIFDSRFDRYGSIAPSSKCDVGCTTTTLKITPSYGSLYGSNEFKKWQDFAGLNIRVHSSDYSVDATVILDSVPEGNPNTLLLRSALPFTPAAGYIIDLAQYSTSTSPLDQQFAKISHVFLSPSVAVTGGSSHTVFTVGAGDVARFATGQLVKLHDSGYVQVSPEAKVVSVVGTTITVDTDLGFAPSTSHTVEMIGFADAQGAYRFI